MVNSNLFTVLPDKIRIDRGTETDIMQLSTLVEDGDYDSTNKQDR